ncbi:DUF1642 domain-containing protein [Streptococcus ruminantium]|uniref:DUF1642 domain-containing protein n=1 Tax=Streptococcus ruminantium TaxID=1917441 RepID=UPI0012DF4120|nr:DUF1642 domain-containing protein [Streptococcus ruminantium]
MNKQEAIKQINSIKSRETFMSGIIWIPKQKVLDIVDQIDEPQKVTVPKVAIDYYEKYKNQLSGFDEWFGDFYDSGFLEEFPDGEKLAEWLYDNTKEVNKQRELALANLIVNGPSAVEIEPDLLYTVKIPNNGGFIVLAYINHAMKLVDGNKHLPGKFTKESIEYAGFGWVFDCEGVTVEEVAK